MNDTTFGVGQINSMNSEELADLKERLYPYMKDLIKHAGVQMIFFMLTDIVKESTELIFVGENAEQLISNAFSIRAQGNSFILKDVVSRKKQLIPAIMADIQQ